MKVKVGDKVRILAGKDRGKEGKVIVTLRKKDKVVVEGINIIKKHMKPTQNSEGGIVSVEAPIHVSNVKVIDGKTNTKTETKKAETKKVEVKKTTAKKTTTKKSTKKEVGEK